MENTKLIDAVGEEWSMISTQTENTGNIFWIANTELTIL